jgi:hypothetical protein
MRRLGLAIVSALALVACGQGGDNPASTADGAGAGGLFPDLNGASYRAEGTIYGDNGQTMPVVQIRSGAKWRMEMNNAQAGQIVAVHTGGEGQNFVLMNLGGTRIATALDPEQYENPMDDWAARSSTATRTGDCSVAGESGAEWTNTDEQGVANTACVTEDGIMLRATNGGRTVWETQTIARGAQSADLFVLPAGVQMIDMNNPAAAADALRRMGQ